MTQTVGKAAVGRSGRFPYVLMYHSVTTYTHDPYRVTVDPARLDQQLRWLYRCGLRGVSMRELLLAHQAGRAGGLVGLTFDDGYTDFVDNVLPAVRRYGFTATVFVLAGRLGGQNGWDGDGPRKNLMTADQVRAVAACGMEVGSHGMVHQVLPSLDQRALSDEVHQSRSVLRELSGQDVRGFCYPYGEVSENVVELVRTGGYDYACAIWRSPLSGRHALPRTYVGDRDRSLRLLAKRLRYRMAARKDRFPRDRR